MSETIAVVDDEPDILELVSLHLEKAGYQVEEFKKGSDLLEFLEEVKPALIILDLMLPDYDGLDLCKMIREDQEYENIPIIMLTAKTEEMDRVLGLELGADDYVTKPFSPRELIARVKAVLRRSEGAEEMAAEEEATIEFGDEEVTVKIFLNSFKVEVNGEEVELTPTEFKILKMLAEKRSWVFSRDQILEYLWGGEKIVVDRTIDVHISHLRNKLGQGGEFIKNVRGVGYKLEI